MKITAVKGKVNIRMKMSPAILKIMKAIPAPNAKWVGSCFEFEPTPASLDFIQKNFPDAEWDDSMKEVITRISEIMMHQVARPEPRPDFAFKTKPYDHQLKAFNISRDEEAFALFMDMGTGKSKVLIDTIAYLWGKGEITAAVIIAPNGVHRNWVLKEIPAHMPDWVEYRAAYWNADMKKADRDAFDVMTQFEGLSFMTINIEALSSERGSKTLLSFVQSQTCLIGVDESSRIKTPGAKRTKTAIKAGAEAKFRRIATGTPVTQGPLDLYSQFEFLGDDLLGFSNFWAFQSQYAIMKPLTGVTDGRGRTVKVVDGYQNIDDLTRRIAPYSFRVTKDECLDLPAKVYEQIPVKLTPDQRRHYDELTEELMTQIGEELIATPIPIVKLIRHRQLVGGFLGEHIFNPNPKLNALIDTLEDIPGKVIIWACFIDEIKAIVEALEKKFGKGCCVEYHGAIPNDQRAENVDLFQEGEPAYFVGQPAAGGIGLTLTAARTVAYYSNDYSLEVRLQSEDRAHRIGQNFKVTYLDFIAESTVDENAVQALLKKQDIASQITGDNLKEWL